MSSNSINWLSSTLVCLFCFGLVDGTTDDDDCLNGEITESQLPDWLVDLQLPLEMLPYVVSAREDLRKRCRHDSDCPFKDFINNGGCIGHERWCDFEQNYSYKNTIDCPGNSRWPEARTKKDQKRLFWRQGDIGFAKERYDSIVDICQSEKDDARGSYLACSDHNRYCQGKNFFFDFKSLNAPYSKRYREGVINPGEVGGRCSKEFRRQILTQRADHRSYLQSWTDELINFKSYDDFRVDRAHCDVIFDRPTVIIKLDAAVNMYHHFCDFVNLFASQFINDTHFDRDVDILWWDTHPDGFRDFMFGVTWRAFSKHPPVELVSLDGKRVCFRSAVMSLLARQRMGLYFNLPLVEGCSGSALFRWFSKFVLHRLGVRQRGPLPNKIRVTLLSRDTQFRRVENEPEILEALRKVPEFDVRRVVYKPYNPPFLEQLNQTHDSDIFMSMHGSGLTHAMFLPDWAAVFEIYNCDDVGCYYDLTRLRGLNYRTWDNATKMIQHGPGKHPKNGTPHKKFTNYSFDVDEFVRIVKEMADYVRAHPQFQKARQKRACEQRAQMGRSRDEL